MRVTRHSEQLPAAAWVSGRQASCTTGPQTQTIDEAGISRTTIVDGLGRNSSVTEDGISATTSYSYDALGNLAGVKQGGFFPCVLAGVSYSRAFSYDSLGRLNTACNPESGTTSYSYYGDGSLFTRTDAESRVLTLNYDVLGRLTHRGYSGSAATPAVDYAYVGTADFLSSVASAASTYTWANYDVLGRPATGTQTTPSVGGAAYNFTNLQWSPQGQLRSITYPSGRIVSTTLDAAGRASSVAGKADAGAAQSSYASSISYAAHGGIAGLTTGDMVTRTVTYNTQLQMTQVQQGSLMTLGFTYDATANNGNMTGAQITRGAFGAAQTFTYDAVNRLKTAAEGAVWNQTYVYDAAGNRALTGNSSMANPGWTPQSPDGVSVPFNAKNQWTAVGGYDLAGNTTTLTQTGTSPLVRQTMTYDAEARMTMWSSTSPVGSAVFSYDGDGRRVTKSSAGLTTTYVYDPVGNLAASYGGAAPPAAATGTLYVTQDHLGSTRLITKGGVAVGCHDYVPFGEEITWGRTAGCYGAADTEVRFTGQVHDSETGLEYFGARHLSGSLGRFLTLDPAGNAVADVRIPQSWNLYGYVQNNPLALVDPTGLCSQAAPGDSFYDDDTHQTVFFPGPCAERAIGGTPNGPVLNGPDPNNPAVEGNVSSTRQGSLWEFFWATIPRQYADYAQNDVALNPSAQQVFMELGKRIDAYPAVCSLGTTARLGLPGSRLSGGFDLNSAKGLRSAIGVKVTQLGPVEGTFSIKGGPAPKSATISAPIPGTPLKFGVSTDGDGLTGVNVGRRFGRFLSLQAYADISNVGDPACR